MFPAGRTLRARRFAPVHLPQRNHRVFLFGFLHFVPVRSARFRRGREFKVRLSSMTTRTRPTGAKQKWIVVPPLRG